MHIFYTQLLIVTAVAMSVPAQVKPDFSGVWTTVEITPPPTAGAGALPPTDLTITHTGATFSVSRMSFGRETTMVYSLDGREDRNQSGAVTRVTRTTWRGASLVTEGRMSQVTSQGYAAWTLTETWEMSPAGRLVRQVESVSDAGDKHRSTVTYRRKDPTR